MHVPFPKSATLAIYGHPSKTNSKSGVGIGRFNGTVYLGSRNNFFSIIVIFVSSGMFLKDVNDRFILSKDERLTPSVDKVMAVYVF